MYSENRFDVNNLVAGVQLMMWGYFKKMVIADRVAIVADYVFANYLNISGLGTIFGVFLYAIQDYTDFSGAIDIARGLSLIHISRCSNNYGPFHFPEKLIPLIITRALANESIPVYGTGENIRDWLHVHDHCTAIDLIIRKGKPGEIYNIGGHNEKTNLEVVKTILSMLDKPESLIKYVEDRKGHDRSCLLYTSRLIAPKSIRTDFVDEVIHDEVVIRPVYLSICAADQRYYTGSRGKEILSEKLPMALIHEAVGKVIYDPKGEYEVGTQVVMLSLIHIYTSDFIKMKKMWKTQIHDIEIIIQAINQLPIWKKEYKLLAVFAQQMSRNPHYFDEGICATMLIHAIAYLFQEPNPIDHLQKTELYYKAGLLKDDMSNFCMICHISAYYEEKKEHPAWKQFYQCFEPWIVNLFNLNQIEKIKAPRYVFIVENPSTFRTDVYKRQI